jgi:hypothetical protein
VRSVSVDLIDRYAAAVGRYLPPANREPVTAAIAVELRTQVLDTERHTGRPMTEDEIAALIKMRGHPYLLAQPYRTGRYLLIGPGLLPQYWGTLKTALTIAFFVVVIVTAVFAAGGTSPVVLLQYLGVFWQLAFYIFIVVTLVFAVLDAVQSRLLLSQAWDPRTLTPAAEPTVASSGTLGEVATAGAFTIWWLAVPHYPWILLGPGARFFSFTSGWQDVYVPVTVCFAASLLVHTTAVIRPGWAWLKRWRGVLANAASVIGVGLLLGAGDLLAPADAAQHVDARTMTIVRSAVRWSLIWTMIVAVVQMIREAVRALRKARPVP